MNFLWINFNLFGYFIKIFPCFYDFFITFTSLTSINNSNSIKFYINNTFLIVYLM